MLIAARRGEFAPVPGQQLSSGAVRIIPPAILLSIGLLCLALAGCDEFDQQGLEHCDQKLQLRFPEPGTGDAFGGGWLITDLDCPASDPVMTLRRSGTAAYEVNLELAHEGKQLRALPGVPLLPETLYNVQLTSGNDLWAWLFTTNSLGSPLGYSLAGHGEELILHQGLLFSPPGMEDILLQHLAPIRPVLQFLMEPGVASVPSRLGTLEMQGALQDKEWSTFDRAVAWDAPYFHLGPLDLSWNIDGWQFVIESAEVIGTSHPAEGGSGRVSLQGRWDTRSADLALGGSTGSLCEISAVQGGGGCIACSDGSNSCLDLLLVHIPTAQWTGELELVF